MSGTKAKLEAAYIALVHKKLEVMFAEYTRVLGRTDSLSAKINETINEAAALKAAALETYEQNT